MQLPQIILTQHDSDRLTRLLEILPHAQREATSALEDELARAEVVASADVPRDVVTMNSRVVFEDMETGRQTEARLVYPHDVAGFNGGAISVLAPVGSALLGMRAGQSIEWRMPSGTVRLGDVVRARDDSRCCLAAGDPCVTCALEPSAAHECRDPPRYATCTEAEPQPSAVEGTFTLQEQRKVSSNLTLHDNRVMYLLQPSELAEGSRGKHVQMISRVSEPVFVSG